MPHPGQAGQKVLQLCQFDLQSTFPAARTLRKDIEDQLCSIDNLARKKIFQVATLGRRKFIVKNDRRHLLVLA